MMELIKIDNGYINADKIIQIYERPIYERPININDYERPINTNELVTVIELEGFGTGNTGPYGEMPYYYQNEVVTKEPLQEVVRLIHDLNTLSYFEKKESYTTADRILEWVEE